MYAPIAVIRSTTTCHDEYRQIHDGSLILELENVNDSLRKELNDAHAVFNKLVSRLELVDSRQKLEGEYFQLKVRLKRMQDYQRDAETAFEDKLKKERLARLDAELRLSQLKELMKKRAKASRIKHAAPCSSRVQSFGTGI